jgi:signal transduction histidine kinase/HAMP domain-containing protein
VAQACILTTFVIVVLSTVAFVLSKSALLDVVGAGGASDEAGVRAMEPGLAMLSNSLTIVGVLLVGFAAATAFLLAVQLTTPLRALVDKVSGLAPGQYPDRTIATGDEVEVLDGAFVDMAGRLAATHDAQEAEIAARTEDLRRQYKLDRAILDAIGYGVVAVDAAGVVTQGNPAAQRALGRDVRGEKIADALRLRTHGGAPGMRLSLERADKTLMPVALSVSPLVDGGSAFGALVVFQDITEERHLDYLKSEFISLASHQLRTPLSAIRWYAELLSDSAQAFSDEQKQYVDEIDRSVRRMIALLGSLLHAARMEDDKLQPELRTVNLPSLVAEAVKDAREVYEGTSIDHRVEAPEESLPVATDAVLLRVVLQNLIGNAVKYSPKESTVSVRTGKNGKNAVITVTDAGLGIPLAEQPRIFEKFFRAENVRRMDTDGNGLGLYISKSIVDRLGGAMSFESVENKGTTFTVTLPMADGQ